MRRKIAGVSGVIAAVCVGLAGTLAADDEQRMVTMRNLQKAYNAESNAKARYEAFATQADQEGHKSVAVLLRAAAKSEAIHAKNFAAQLTRLGAEPTTMPDVFHVKSTRENLEACLKGQTSADESMYPGLIKQAEVDKDSATAVWFKAAYAAETQHAKLFKAALSTPEDWKAAGKVFGVCQACGYTVMGKSPTTCPICSGAQNQFTSFPE